MGLLSSSKSSTANYYKANPLTVDEGVGVAAENSTVNITDGGIVARALQTVDLSNATQNDGFSKLLAAGESLIGQTQKHVADAYASAKDSATGSIDNRTLIALGAVVVAGIFMFNNRMA